MRIGITGGIGSGKSFVCSIFKDYNFKIYNSDFEAKNILNKNQNEKNTFFILSSSIYFLYQRS